MFNIQPIIQKGDSFDGMFFLDRVNIGGVGKDDKGLYINLARELTLDQTIEMLKYLERLKSDFYSLKLVINYIE